MHQMLVKDIMVTDVISVDRYANFCDLVKILEHYDVHHLPVTEEGNHLIGILSTTDILKNSLSTSFFSKTELTDKFLDQNISVNRIMQTQPVTVNPLTSVTDAAQILHKSKFNCLPVIEDKNTLVGIITTKDLIGCLLKITSGGSNE